MVQKFSCTLYNVSLDTPFKDLPEDFVQELLYGENNIMVEFVFDSKFGGRREYKAPFEGVIVNSREKIQRN